ncbi:MAG: DUF5655 domain-containing protein [Caldilineaceae bacterium]
MTDLAKAQATQINNILTKTGKTPAELTSLMQSSGLSKHGELRDWFKRELGLGHGDANALVHYLLQSDGQRSAQAAGKSDDAVVDEIYIGAKAALRPIHDALMKHISNFGEFEIVPKKGYISLRRKKQFAMIGPATNSRVEVGINAKGLVADDRLSEQPAGSMCNYKVKLTETSEVNEQLIEWLQQAYEAAG